MNATTARGYTPDVDLHNLPARETGRNNGAGPFIGGNAVFGHHDTAVCNVEINIGAAETTTGCFDFTRLFDEKDFQFTAPGIGGLLQRLNVPHQDLMPFTARVRIEFSEHHTRSYEAGQAIHVAVGLIVIRVARQPDDLFHTQRVTQFVLRISFAQTRIAIVIQNSLFSGE